MRHVFIVWYRYQLKLTTNGRMEAFLGSSSQGSIGVYNVLDVIEVKPSAKRHEIHHCADVDQNKFEQQRGVRPEREHCAHLFSYSVEL